MVSTKNIIFAGAALALFAPQIVARAGQAAGQLGTGLATGISELGSVQIRPALSPEFAPRFAPDIDIPGVDLGSFVNRLLPGVSREDPNDQSLELKHWAFDPDQPRDAPDPLEYEKTIPSHPFTIGTGEGYED